MTIIIERAGGRVSSSRNLRGLTSYARSKARVVRWFMTMTDSYGATIAVEFADGAKSTFEFASWDVAQRWVRSRRSWGLSPKLVRPTCEEWTA